MPTLTALQPRPFVFARAYAKIELVQALPEDLKVYAGIDVLGNKMYDLRVGLVYWLSSSLTGEVEPSPRKLTAECNPNELKKWLDNKMIWIPKLPIV